MPQVTLPLVGRVASEASGVGSSLPLCKQEPHPDRLHCVTAVDPPHKGEGNSRRELAHITTARSAQSEIGTPSYFPSMIAFARVSTRSGVLAIRSE